MRSWTRKLAFWLTGHAPPTRLPLPTPRFAGIQAAASSWRLSERNHEAAWSWRPSRWCQQASRVTAAQTAQRLLPEAWDCRRQVRSGSPGGPTTSCCKVKFRVEQSTSKKAATKALVRRTEGCSIKSGRRWGVNRGLSASASHTAVNSCPLSSESDAVGPGGPCRRQLR